MDNQKKKPWSQVVSWVLFHRLIFSLFVSYEPLILFYFSKIILSNNSLQLPINKFLSPY